LADYPSTPLPVYPIEEQPVEPEVLVSTHRDGSEQRRLKGPGRKRIFRLSYGGDMPVTNTQRLAIENHFSGQNGRLTAFNWTHPERGTVHICRYAETPRVRHVGYNAYEIEVVLQEVPA